MNTRRWLTMTGIVAVAMLALAVGLTWAQGPEPPAKEDQEMQLQSDAATAAVPRTIPIQGRLTDGTGAPITGTHTITLTLYTTRTAGAMVCQSAQSVHANNGLFNTVIDTCTSDDIDGKDLYLGIQVEGDAEMTPRQQIYPVPYAYSLVPGARISGTVSTYQPVLSVVNNKGNGINVKATDYGIYVPHAGRDGVWVDEAIDDGLYVSDAGDAGVYVANADNYGGYAKTNSGTGSAVYAQATAGSGLNYGIRGRSHSPDGYGVYGVNYEAGGVAVMADGTGIIKSVADTTIAVSPLKAVTDPHVAHPNLVPQQNGTLELNPTDTGSQYIYVPVDLPTQVFGVEQRLEAFRLCYELTDSTSYISQVGVYTTNDSGDREKLINDTSARTNRWWTCYTFHDFGPSVIPHSVFLRIQLEVSDVNDTITIGSIELTLTED